MLAPVSEASYGEEPLLRLGRASLERYPAFVEELARASGVPIDLRTQGTVLVGFDADDMRALEVLHEFHRELGLPTQRLTASQARRREGTLSPRVRGALLIPTDYSIEPRALHAALLAAATASRVRMLRARVDSVQVADARVTGLRLADGVELPADVVVVALGAWSGTLPGAPSMPVRPVKGQILRLRAAAGLLGGTVRALVRGRSIYLVPFGADGLIVGATAEEKGFDGAVTAGAAHDLLHDAIEVVPAVRELELVETVARWRPGTPDNAPILGPSTIAGLVVATGHYRNGVLLTPITADIVADLLTTGKLPDIAEPFQPGRFETGRIAAGRIAAGRIER